MVLQIKDIPEANQRKIAELLKKKDKLTSENGLMFYEPHAKQDLFHANGDKKRRYVRTGNRFGKSTLGAAEDCAWALGYRPWYPEDDPKRYIGIPKHATKGCIVCVDWDKAEEIFTNPVAGERAGKLFQLLPKSRIVRKIKNNSGKYAEIHVKSIHGGISIIMLETVKSWLSNPMGAESSDWDWIHVDEPCPQGLWTALSRGLIDRGGCAWFTCTPLNEAWINDMFVPSRRTRITLDKPLMKDESHWMITGESSDNPHLSKADMDLFFDQLSDAERQCREKGIPLSLSGLIYKDFNHEVHIYNGTPIGWQKPDRPPGYYTIRVSVDTHPETPHAVMFAATSPHGQTYLYAEIFQKLLIEDLCDEIIRVLDGQEPESMVVDPAAWIRHPNDGSCMADIFFEKGLLPLKAPKDLVRGIQATQQILARRQRTPKGQTVPILQFGTDLLETIFEFDHYEWDIRKENKPKDKDDHLMECLYRLVIGGLTHIKYKEFKNSDFQNSYISSTPDMSFSQDATPEQDRVNAFNKRYR